jgi:hypothetical protein
MSNAFNLSQLANNVNSSGLLSASAGITGTLPVANGGTGAATLTANNVILGNGTSAPTFVAPGTNGNVLTSNGTTWTSAAAAGGGVTSLNGQTGAVVNTAVDAIGSYGGFVYAGSSDVAIGATTAGSNLRYNSGGTGYFEFNAGTQWFQYYYKTGDNPTFPGGGTSLSGTWRRMPSGVSYSVFTSGVDAKSGVLERFWFGAFFVRVS